MASAGKYIDLQVNGYAGIDFNGDELSLENLHYCCSMLKRDNLRGILATIITDEVEAMEARLKKIGDCRDQDPLVREMIIGFHVEGPFINETRGYVGAHSASAVRPADLSIMKRLIDAAHGLTRIVTLAPERDPAMSVTRYLADNDVIVSAGHCDPSLEQLVAAMDAGLSMFTHLGNGCPAQLHRHDNIIQRVLGLSDNIRITVIADGVHVPFFVLRNFLRWIPPDNAIVVSDCISATGQGPGVYKLVDTTAVIGDDLVARSEDGTHFVGSTCPLWRVEEHLRTRLNLSDERINALLLENPLSVLPRDESLAARDA